MVGCTLIYGNLFMGNIWKMMKKWGSTVRYGDARFFRETQWVVFLSCSCPEIGWSCTELYLTFDCQHLTWSPFRLHPFHTLLANKVSALFTPQTYMKTHVLPHWCTAQSGPNASAFLSRAKSTGPDPSVHRKCGTAHTATRWPAGEKYENQWLHIVSR